MLHHFYRDCVARSLPRVLALLACSILLTGCLTTRSYVDPALPVVSRADFPEVVEPRPAQLLFEFRTNGNPNAAVTREVRPRVLAVADASGLFSAISQEPTEGASQLVIVIDNIPLTDNAAGKGFGTGLTFGAVGTMVSDGYRCTATWTENGTAFEASVEHALHTTVGNHSGPAGLQGVTTAEGINQVMDQLVWNVLRDLAVARANGKVEN